MHVFNRSSKSPMLEMTVLVASSDRAPQCPIFAQWGTENAGPESRTNACAINLWARPLYRTKESPRRYTSVRAQLSKQGGVHHLFGGAQAGGEKGTFAPIQSLQTAVQTPAQCSADARQQQHLIGIFKSTSILVHVIKYYLSNHLIEIPEVYEISRYTSMSKLTSKSLSTHQKIIRSVS